MTESYTQPAAAMQPTDETHAATAHASGSTTIAATSDDRPVSEADALPHPSAMIAPADADEGGKGGKGAGAPPSPPSAAPSPTDDWPGGRAATGDAELRSKPAAPPSPDTVGEPVGDDVYRPAPPANPVLAALKRTGLYVEPAGDGRHRIRSPWPRENPATGTADAIYREPTVEVPLGTYYCPCPQTKPRRVEALLEHLQIDQERARCKPRIRAKSGELHRVVWAAEKVLHAQGGFYLSNNVLVRIRTDAETGDVATEPLTEHALSMELSALCDWQKFDARAGEWRRCDVPPPVVKGILAAQGLKLLPVIERLTRQPFLRRSDGALRMTPGYDPSCKVFAAFDAAAFDIPAPTRENALAALQRLTGLLKEFEFAAPSDRATAISAMLTATIRDYLRLAPAFNITASSPGSGKSYLASVIAPFAGPGQPRNVSYPRTDEEATKVVLSLALEQPAVVLFDDMPTDWLPHGAMNRMLTNGSITERLLGSSRVVTARTASFVMGTGNNIRPLRDMARRVTSIYLLPQAEVAATRSYNGDPAEAIRRDRGRYVADALTIVSAWRAAGSPRADVPNVAGFEEWSDLCRHSLIWLGLDDPATSLIEQLTHDPDTDMLGDLLAAWKDVFGTRPTLVRQVLAKIEQGGTAHDDLKDAVMELPCVERGHVNKSRFGRFLGRNKNRIVNGLQLVEAEHSERRAWKVVAVGPKPDPVPVLAENDAPPNFASAWQVPLVRKADETFSA